MTRPPLVPLADRDALRVMFVITCMPVGGAETLLVELIRRMDRERFVPELCCLKYFGPLGELLAREVPAFDGLLAQKYDVGVWRRLTRLLAQRRIDAVVTVGTGGDKMFWGRLAARRARVPVVVSALHSTGLPDRVEWPNRLLTPWTDAFVAVADSHARYLAQHEGCPRDKIRVIPNGVDASRFRTLAADPELRRELGIPRHAPLVGIVAALRPEKNHELFLRAAARVSGLVPMAEFLVVGDGPRRAHLESMANELGIAPAVHFAGTRADVPRLLNLLDVLLLTSHMEASPVSILEAMACAIPVVATRVGSVPEVMLDGQCGFLVDAGDELAVADKTCELLRDRPAAKSMGQRGRQRVVEHYTVESMVAGYQQLITSIYSAKCAAAAASPLTPVHAGERTE